MKKILLSFTFLLGFYGFIFAQKTVNVGKLSKKFEKKYDFMTIESWNTLNKKDTYIPYFSEKYYEATATEILIYHLNYPNNTTFTTATIDQMGYTEEMLSSVYITKISFKTFDTEDFTFEIEKDENRDWVEFHKKDKGATKIMERYKKPYFKIFYRLKEDAQVAYTEYSIFSDGVTEMKTENGGYFTFEDEARAQEFLKILTEKIQK